MEHHRASSKERIRRRLKLNEVVCAGVYSYIVKLSLLYLAKRLKIYASEVYANRLVKKISLLLLLTFLSTATLPLTVEATTQYLLVYVDRNVALNSYGYLLLNDTITFVNNSTSSLRLPTLTLTYPTSVMDLQVQRPLDEDSVKLERVGNVTLVRLSADITIPATSNFTIALTAMLGELLKPLGKSKYEMIVPMPSSEDSLLAKAVVTISLPTDVNPLTTPEEFKMVSGGGNIYSAMLKNIQPTTEPRTAKLLLNGTEYSLTVLRVEREKRVVKIVSPTEVIVFDTLNLVNDGDGTLSSLKILDTRLSSVTLVREDIPLRDQKTISIISGSLDFYSLINEKLKAGERISFTLSYQLPERVASDSTLLLKIPQKPLVDALVKDYHLIIDAPKGCKVEGPTLLDLSYSSPISGKQISVYVRFGVAWASAYAFPVATLIFLASFIALSTYVAYRREEKKKPLVELIELYEEVISFQETIADELTSESLDHLKIQKIDLFAQQIKEIRTKASQKASQILSKLTLNPKSEKTLTELISLDKAYERALTELLAAYRGYLSGKMKLEAFQKVTSEKSSSLRKLASSIREILDQISQM